VQTIILGAGVSGLAAAWASGFPVLEVNPLPGGICRSYYQRPHSDERLSVPPEDGGAYRFEVGGGHWIFAPDAQVLWFLSRIGELDSYQRRAAVYFPSRRLLVPFPLQYHLSCLPDLAERAWTEIARQSRPAGPTLADWLEATFGQTLCEHFFGPFHERYTAGLSRHIAPQDGYKTPFDLARVQRGLTGKGTNAGYNTFFHYPRRGLQHVADHMAAGARLQTGCRIVSVKPAQHELLLDNGSGARYQTLLSTLPLNRTAALMGLDPEEDPWPATAVLVLNLGAARGPACPDEHWIYVPNSRSGFFRVGFYSNVDNRFLPAAAEGKVSLYVERAFAEGARPSEEEVAVYTASAMAELREWGFIGEPEAVSRTWVDVAYTWARPGSQWRERTLAALEQRGVFMTGRYARWRFEGIAESIRDGFAAGAALRPSRP